MRIIQIEDSRDFEVRFGAAYPECASTQRRVLKFFTTMSKAIAAFNNLRLKEQPEAGPVIFDRRTVAI